MLNCIKHAFFEFVHEDLFAVQNQVGFAKTKNEKKKSIKFHFVQFGGIRDDTCSSSLGTVLGID